MLRQLNTHDIILNSGDGHPKECVLGSLPDVQNVWMNLIVVSFVQIYAFMMRHAKHFSFFITCYLLVTVSSLMRAVTTKVLSGFAEEGGAAQSTFAMRHGACSRAVSALVSRTSSPSQSPSPQAAGRDVPFPSSCLQSACR